MDGQIVIGTKIDTKSFESQIDALEDKLDTLTKEYSVAMKDADFPEEEILKYRKEIEQTTNKLIKLKKQQDDLGKTGLQNVGKSMSSIISKVTKWGLAVFGVRSAYMFVRQAMSTLSQYDDQMATDLEYISWVIANTLKPVIEWIIEAVYKVLGAFGALIKAISGVNIFANSSAKAFEKIKKNAKATSKATKEIKKDLYGWDEATRIEESSGLAGGIGSTKTPSIDIEKETDDMFEKAKKTAKETGALATVPFVYIYLKIKDAWDKSINLLKGTYNDILKPYIITPIKNTINKTKELLKPITNFFNEYFVSPIKGMFNNLRQALAPIINGIIDDVNHLLEPLGLKIPRIEDKIKKGTVATEKTIKGATQRSGQDIEENLTDNLKDTIYYAEELGSQKYNIDIKAPELNPIEKTINKLKEGLKTLTKKTWKINSTLAISGATKGAVSGATQINAVNIQMAKGGILNNPGRGVPVGGAIAGERGKEFYMPLQDEQMLSMVGEAIGRYVTINLTNTIKMNARQIAKETKRVSAENDFATNS